VTPLFFEDFIEGHRFETAGVTLTEAEIVGFALVYDPQPFHIDTVAASASEWGGLIASGFQTLGLSFRLFQQTGAIRACSLGGTGIDELRWPRPVRPGDTLRVEVEVLERKPSRSRPDRGLVRMLYRTLNQHGEVVQTCICNHILARRPAADQGRAVASAAGLS
jgi:acyl dehydratase